MFVKKSNCHGRIFLSFAQGYRVNGKVRHKTIEKIGYLDELEKKYDDPIAHFKEIAKQRSIEQVTEITIKNLNTKIIDSSSYTKNLGYIPLKKIYEELGLDDFMSSKNKSLKIDYDLNKIFSLLVYSRIMYPSSKKETFEGKDRFFENFDEFTLKDVYRSLDYFNEYKEEIETLLWNNTKDKYKRKTDNLYYDCTNYYFEINYNDVDLVDEEGNILEKGYRKRGPEKNHRPDPIIEMGLLMDSTNIPLSYDLFPGNESEKLSLLLITRRTKSNCNLGRAVLVADRGLNTSDNIYFLAGKNTSVNMDGYIYGQSVRGADEEFKNWVLDQKDYIEGESLLAYLKEQAEKEIQKKTKIDCKIYPVRKLNEYSKQVQEKLIKEDNLLELKYYYLEKELLIKDWSSKEITKEITELIETTQENTINRDFSKRTRKRTNHRQYFKKRRKPIIGKI